jgi:hypothetical protein
VRNAAPKFLITGVFVTGATQTAFIHTKQFYVQNASLSMTLSVVKRSIFIFCTNIMMRLLTFFCHAWTTGRQGILSMIKNRLKSQIILSRQRRSHQESLCDLLFDRTLKKRRTILLIPTKNL